jgi:molecular chaperone HtpG
MAGAEVNMTSIATHPFQADVSQILKLVIHSLYSHREIFLRELISNASDALDRLRFRAISDDQIMEGDTSLEIRIRLDKERGELRIEDTGVGMTEEEVVKNLGTVAHSGSRTFLEQLAKNGARELNLIGQFGVGFYSSYLVADRVDVITRAAGPGAQAVKWSSIAAETFTVEPAERSVRGTEIILHLREDQRHFLDRWKVRELCGRYSDYVAYPIKLELKTGEEVHLEQINQASALWRRPKSEIADSDYSELYKHLTGHLDEPLGRVHFKVEGKQEFVGLLYIPRLAPYDLDDGRKRRGVRLFVRRVFVMGDCDEVLPQWLRFLRGVVDSDDLPLNVSRELLQDSTTVHAIKKQIIKRTLDLLDEMAKDRPHDYLEFWGSFGRLLKEGLALGREYAEYKDNLAALVRYESTSSEGLTSLAEYVARMPPEQQSIYYIFGPSKAALSGSPHLEGLRARGWEVLYMTQPVDQWAADAIREFSGKPLVSVMQADLPLAASEQATAREEVAVDLKALAGRIEKTLSKQIQSVRISQRLTDSPCCLVLASGAPAPFMEQLLKSSRIATPTPKRILEINPAHPLIGNLSKILTAEPDAPQLEVWIEVLYNQALLTEGSPIEDPGRLAGHLASLLTTATVSSTTTPC